MAVLQSTNVQGTLCVNGVAVGGGKDFKYCCFTASDTFTPSQDLVDGDGVIDTFTVGGGGGGGGGFQWFLQAQQPSTARICSRSTTPSTNCCLSGGSGMLGQALSAIDSTDAISVTVGAGGLGGRVGTGSDSTGCCSPDYTCLQCSASTDGGTTCFGDKLISPGGGGGRNVWMWCCVGQSNCYCCQRVCGDTVYPNNGTFINNTYGGGSFCQNYGANFLDLYTGSACWTAQPRDNATASFLNDSIFGLPGGDKARPTGMDCTGTDVWTSSVSVGTDSGVSYDGTVGFATVGISCGGQTATAGQIGCIVSYDFNKSKATSALTKYYGHGGNHGIACVIVKNCTPGLQCMFSNMNGADGNDGLVVLKWYE